MTLEEKIKIILDVFKNLDDNLIRSVKRNLLKELENLDAKDFINIIQVKMKLLNKDIYLNEDLVWFFLRLYGANGFEQGKITLAKAMKRHGRETSESKLAVLMNQDSFNTEFSHKEFIREIKFFAGKGITIDLESLYKDIISWEKYKIKIRTKWAEEYIDNDKEIKE